YAAAIVYEHDMHLLSRPRLLKMAGIRGDRLSRGAARQQPQKDAKVTPLRDQLLDTHTGDVDVSEMPSHVGIPFIRTDHEFPRLGNGKVYPCQRYPAGEEFLPQVE